MTAGAITALTFRKPKQITIKGILGVGKHSSCEYSDANLNIYNKLQSP